LAGAARVRAETLRDRVGAAEVYEELLRVAPEHPEALRFRAELLYESGRFDEAVKLFERMESQEAGRDLDDFDAQVEVASFFFRFAEALRRIGRNPEA
ncbi:tetratricopeptide repeat protein, partial [Clostridium perfringens]|nr:tetratricopeptide repeat protein [Clostridium perfringens]